MDLDFKEFKGKTVRWQDAYDVPSMCEVLEDSGDFISASIDYRAYKPEEELISPDDPERYWKIQPVLNIDLDGSRVIRRIFVGTNLYADGISGLGSAGAASFWTKEDMKKAEEFLRLLTDN